MDYKDLDKTEEPYWYEVTEGMYRSQDHSHTEVQIDIRGSDPIKTQMLDAGIQFHIGGDSHDIRLARFEEPQELRKLADWLHRQADLFEGYNAEVEEFEEQYDSEEMVRKNGIEWIEEHFPHPTDYWEENTD
jgi:hypothetical protein